ncbi:type II toxin-antitoxin system Phd/YefM family antitoxin [Paramicrobacterium agarici]|uniref:Antitoxin n=1 Tax=Paramicrobacterium agarici TaxID=630514 RepID=A0A2A9DYG2_9MICO|nr:type II toxin-antitoxin system prevent-host-death family antitoxin [Microbacterium agarici]PFG31847.1 prevent-host-death family protein [Microbacterium agarici]
MSDIGIRALKQNASAVVAAAAKGETVTITDRGRPVAQLSPMPLRRLDHLTASGQLRAPRRSIEELSAPKPGELTSALRRGRDNERF